MEEIRDSQIIDRKAITHPCIINARYWCLWSVEYKKCSQIGSVGCHNDHCKAGPHHAQHSCTETARCACVHTTVTNKTHYLYALSRAINISFIFTCILQNRQSTRLGKMSTKNFKYEDWWQKARNMTNIICAGTNYSCNVSENKKCSLW